MHTTTASEGRASECGARPASAPPLSAPAPVETAATAAYPWARRVGALFRFEARGLPDNAMSLLRIAFGDDGPGYTLPGDLLRAHDRALGVLVVLSGLSPRALETRARREGRTNAFAEAAAWAFSIGDRDPLAFHDACRTFRRIQREWDEGVTAALLGFSDASRGAIFSRALAYTRGAVARHETWALVGQMRAKNDRSEGFVHGASEGLDDRMFVRNPAYRAGALAGMMVRTLAGDAAVRIEIATMQSRRRVFGRS